MNRRIMACVVVGLLASATSAAAIDLKVTDSKGTEVVVTGASVDYSGMLSSDKETTGLRAASSVRSMAMRSGWARIGITISTNCDVILATGLMVTRRRSPAPDIMLG